MVNKLWYQGYIGLGQTEEECKDYRIARDRIQQYIDYYCFDAFKVPEDITIDNLDIFFKIILPLYEKYLFEINELWCLGESMSTYFHVAYHDDIPEGYLNLARSDRRSIALEILDKLDTIEQVFPEDVPFLLDCLDAPAEEIKALSKNGIADYFKQFNRAPGELGKRYKLLKKQRLIAMANDDPLPIRPMGMKLDPCYKKDRRQ